MAKKKSALGRGLSSLIPEKKQDNASDKNSGGDTSSSSGTSQATGQSVIEISVEKINTNPHQPRTDFSAGELEDLLQSIDEHGILQPLVVTQDEGGFELVAGERRLRAARELGLDAVPVIVREATEQEKLELALIENIQRQDLNPVEEALAYRALADEFNLKQAEVAKRVGKSRSTVANALRLLELEEEMLDALRRGKISKSHARTLLSEDDPQQRKKLFKAILQGQMTVRDTESAVSKKKSSRKSNQTKTDPNMRAHEKTLRDIFGTKVEIKKRGKKGEIKIEFYSPEELKKLLKQFKELQG
jgi:ParB family chromosome partitioning protein